MLEEEFGRRELEDELYRSIGDDAPESRFSLFTFPRRFTRPASGRSPDSRFIGLAAFPIRRADQWHVG